LAITRTTPPMLTGSVGSTRTTWTLLNQSGGCQLSSDATKARASSRRVSGSSGLRRTKRDGRSAKRPIETRQAGGYPAAWIKWSTHGDARVAVAMSRRLSSYTARERRWMAARPLHGGLNSQDASWICVAAPAGRSSAGITSGRGSSRLSKREIPPPPTRSKPTTSPASLLLSREGFVCHCAERSAAYASGARRSRGK